MGLGSLSEAQNYISMARVCFEAGRPAELQLTYTGGPRSRATLLGDSPSVTPVPPSPHARTCAGVATLPCAATADTAPRLIFEMRSRSSSASLYHTPPVMSLLGSARGAWEGRMDGRMQGRKGGTDGKDTRERRGGEKGTTGRAEGWGRGKGLRDDTGQGRGVERGAAR